MEEVRINRNIDIDTAMGRRGIIELMIETKIEGAVRIRDIVNDPGVEKAVESG